MIPLEQSSSGIACALPGEVVDVIVGADPYMSLDHEVELGAGTGAFGPPSGESCAVVFVILQREEFGDTVVPFQPRVDVDVLNFAPSGQLPNEVAPRGKATTEALLLPQRRPISRSGTRRRAP